jgi:hypothetical protein
VYQNATESVEIEGGKIFSVTKHAETDFFAILLPLALVISPYHLTVT